MPVKKVRNPQENVQNAVIITNDHRGTLQGEDAPPSRRARVTKRFGDPNEWRLCHP